MRAVLDKGGGLLGKSGLGRVVTLGTLTEANPVFDRVEGEFGGQIDHLARVPALGLDVGEVVVTRLALAGAMLNNLGRLVIPGQGLTLVAGLTTRLLVGFSA